MLPGEREAPIEVAQPDGVALAGGLEPLGGVLAHGVEQAEALTLHDDERLLDQPGKQIDDPPPGDRTAGADLLGRLKREPTGEDREATMQDALLAGEEVVAPVDRGPQRLLAGQRGAAAGAEHVEAVAKARRDLVERQRARAGRGELDRQRHAVQTPANLLHGPCGAVRGIEPRTCRGGALAEQPRAPRPVRAPARRPRRRSAAARGSWPGRARRARRAEPPRPGGRRPRSGARNCRERPTPRAWPGAPPAPPGPSEIRGSAHRRPAPPAAPRARGR